MKQLLIIFLYVIGIFLMWLSKIYCNKLFLYFGIGAIFELVTHNMWKYKIHQIFLPLGWIGCLAISNVTQILLNSAGLNLYVSYILGFLIIGSLCELFFLKIGCWDYNYQGTILGTKPLQWPISKIEIFGVPLSIILGYGVIFGNIIFLIDRLM